jgi:ribose 5-phosphate isomerase
MILGLGSGSTAAFAIEALAARIAKGLRVVGIPTSETTAASARRLGVPLTSFAEHRRIDVAIDGADQVACGTLDLVKGLGGALLREKIVASASDRMIVVVDETKLVDRLGGNTPLPVEIVSFGWQTVLDRLAAIGCAPRLRLAGDEPFTTDGGNYSPIAPSSRCPIQRRWKPGSRRWSGSSRMASLSAWRPRSWSVGRLAWKCSRDEGRNGRSGIGVPKRSTDLGD